MNGSRYLGVWVLVVFFFQFTVMPLCPLNGAGWSRGASSHPSPALVRSSRSLTGQVCRSPPLLGSLPGSGREQGDELGAAALTQTHVSADPCGTWEGGESQKDLFIYWVSGERESEEPGWFHSSGLEHLRAQRPGGTGTEGIRRRGGQEPDFGSV